MDTMGTPEKGSIGKTPSTPEGESKPEGFSIRVESPDLIFEALERGVSGELGRHLLESPVTAVSAQLSAGEYTFNLFGKVKLDFTRAVHFKRVNVYMIIEAVAQRFLSNNPEGKIVERGGNYIVIAPRGTKFVLGEEAPELSNIVVSTCLLNTAIEPLQVIPAPQAKRESFDRVMADFIDVFKATVEEIYKAERKTPPDEELVLRPPKVGVEDLGGRVDLTTIPPELLDKMKVEIPDFPFENIGGQEEAKKEIEGIAFALKNPELYRKWGTEPPKGVILYGPPGTGKTLMAKALASQAEALFLHVKVSDIVSKWFGESEKIIDKIFEYARAYKGKVIIFFDELDTIAPHREGAHEVTQRIISTLLVNMDGMTSYKNIIIVASTNRLEAVDPALVRAGRFDRWVEVPLPDEEGRKQIFEIHMRKAQEVAGREDLFNDVNLNLIVTKTEGLSGADIAEIIRRALEEKVRQEGTTGLQPGGVTTDDILTEIEKYEKARKRKKPLGFQNYF